MFTGLVRQIGCVRDVRREGSVWRLRIDADATATVLAIGDSVAVNGICLTVTGLVEHGFDVEATAETRRVTTLGSWRIGERVHLEPSLRAGDPIGGHFVLGHIDGVGRVTSILRGGAAATMRVEVARRIAAGLVPKGSIAVDGVSLTLDGGPFGTWFTVTLIPHTLEMTRFGGLSSGENVNLELDVLTKAARNGSGEGKPRLTLSSLLERGWRQSARNGDGH